MAMPVSNDRAKSHCVHVSPNKHEQQWENIGLDNKIVLKNKNTGKCLVTVLSKDHNKRVLASLGQDDCKSNEKNANHANNM